MTDSTTHKQSILHERCFRITALEEGERLDKVLAGRLPEFSRAHLQDWIRNGAVQITGARGADGENGAEGTSGVGTHRVCSPAHRLSAGVTLTLNPPPITDSVDLGADSAFAAALPFSILYEDEDIVVIDKPAGLVMHPAPGHSSGTLSQALLARYGGGQASLGGRVRSGLVHRLDKGTSGVLVAARTALAWNALARDFAAHTTERRYLALVCGAPSLVRGVVRGQMARDPRTRQKMAFTTKGGRESETRYRVRSGFGGGVAALLEARPLSGRTHQIRLHLSACGHPILGEDRYSGRHCQRVVEERLGYRVARPLLHAWRLSFSHPASGEAMRFHAPPAADFIRALTTLTELTELTERTELTDAYAGDGGDVMDEILNPPTNPTNPNESQR
ncbi:MAG: RluA family pseudouridine synthase [Alphaproteobacteria bacterium]